MSQDNGIEEFMSAFPGRAAADRDLIPVLVADETVRQFRFNPEAALAAVDARLNALVAASQSARPIAWCQPGDANHGLDGFEVEAVLGRRMHLTSVDHVNVDGEKRILAIGRLRRDYVAVVFHAEGVDDRQLAAFLDTAGEAMVFITAARLASALAVQALSSALDRFQSGGGRLSLIVPEAATEAALASPGAHVAPFTQRGGQPRTVRFERGSIEPSLLTGFLTAIGATCDSSVAAGVVGFTGNVLVRDGAYSGASPYRPQPFDLRVPWFHTEPGMWIELPSLPVDAGFSGSFHDRRHGMPDHELARRLDVRRMAAFYRASAITPALEEQYPDYRVYNWPAPAPAERAWLLDGGAATVTRLADVSRALSTTTPGTLVRVGEDDLLRVAEAEVVARYGFSSAAAIDVQNAQHTYLADIPRDVPLRQDYADFARFAPADLGDTLEIGSGYGVLAWALSPRARRYVCADLDAAMFRSLRRDLHQSGVVADAHRMPFASGRFDAVVANNVIEHLYDPLDGLREIRRILKPGGRLLALLPFDALDNQFDLPAHLWKIDEAGLKAGLTAAGFSVSRLEIVNLHALGVRGAFPSCRGFAAMVDATPGNEEPAEIAPTVWRQVPRLSNEASHRAGRVWPSMREPAGFERWAGRTVVAIGADARDIEEFQHFGATVAAVDPEGDAWPVANGGAALVYAFLTVSPARLASLSREIKRVLAPKGAIVAAFRHRHGLRYLSRVRSYFGTNCDVDRLAGRDRLAYMTSDDGAVGDEDYVTTEQVATAFAEFPSARVTVCNLTPDDLAASVRDPYPHEFWDWLSSTCGRFVMVKAQL